MSVARVLSEVRRDLPRLADAPRREDHCLRLEHHHAAALAPVADGADHAVAVLEQARDRALHVHVEALVDAVVLQRADHLEPGAVTDVGAPRVALAADLALPAAAVRGAVEAR